MHYPSSGDLGRFSHLARFGIRCVGSKDQNSKVLQNNVLSRKKDIIRVSLYVSPILVHTSNLFTLTRATYNLLLNRFALRNLFQ